MVALVPPEGLPPPALDPGAGGGGPAADSIRLGRGWSVSVPEGEGPTVLVRVNWAAGLRERLVD